MPADESVVPRVGTHDLDGQSQAPDAIPAARAADQAQQPVPALPPADAPAVSITVDGQSELVESLMTGLSVGEREHLVEMINSSIEAERTAAFDGTVRRQVDVGVRRRRSSRSVQDADNAGA
ncbi:hypothetical protein [Frankia sp. R82]|uniref:hypothetical protein n=1 Tax=Frankia sp. R82 TaxID=2950553 RepID=UPI00204457AE|nr:hypothetical protein [Frankia sp. R82]MCM3882409.1 hypothetical protein [Frankia sp. R82]